MKSNIIYALGIIGLGLLGGCGGNGSGDNASTNPPPAITVAITPEFVTLASGAVQTFTATVTGTADNAALFSVREGAAGGSISPAGIYTAPQSPGTYHVVATSSADTTKSAAATVTLAAPVSITPPIVSIVPRGMQTFTATVTGFSNTAVTFSILEGATGGSITAAGVYTAPATPGTYQVVATSVADTNNSAAATVTVSSPPSNLTGTIQSVDAPTGVLQVVGVTVTVDATTLVVDGQTGSTGPLVLSDLQAGDSVQVFGDWTDRYYPHAIRAKQVTRTNPSTQFMMNNIDVTGLPYPILDDQQTQYFGSCSSAANVIGVPQSPAWGPCSGDVFWSNVATWRGPLFLTVTVAGAIRQTDGTPVASVVVATWD